jgi:hypothetical protein
MLIRRTKTTQRTSRANKVRRERYLSAVHAALPLIRDARAVGLVNAQETAWFLNFKKLPAPNGERWSVDAVLRALRKLRQIGAGDVYMAPNEARGPSYYNDSNAKYAAIMASSNTTQSVGTAQDA